MIKKILLVLSVILIISSCSTIENHRTTIDQEKIILSLYFHKFNELKQDNDDIWLLACYTHFYDNNDDFDNVSIVGYKELGIVNQELSEDTKYTSDYCDNKILIQDDKPVNIQYFIIQSKLDLYKEATKNNIKAIVRYNHQDYNIRASRLSKI